MTDAKRLRTFEINLFKKFVQYFMLQQTDDYGDHNSAVFKWKKWMKTLTKNDQTVFEGKASFQGLSFKQVSSLCEIQSKNSEKITK